MRNKMMQKIKSSKPVWKHSGLTYMWSVLATRGKYFTIDVYLDNNMEKIKSISNDVKQKKVF